MNTLICPKTFWPFKFFLAKKNIDPPTPILDINKFLAVNPPTHLRPKKLFFFKLFSPVKKIHPLGIDKVPQTPGGFFAFNAPNTPNI